MLFLPSRLPSLSTVVLAGLLSFGHADLVLAQDAELVVTHAQGQTEVPSNPDKVFVYDLAALDTLDALGVEIDGVPGSNLPDYLSKYGDDAYLKIGTLFEPDLEAVAAEQPDLVIVGGRSAAKYEVLSEMAPTIDLSVDTDTYLASAEENARTLGKIFGKEDEADAKIAALNESIEKLKTLAADAGTGLIVLTTGNKLSAFGPGSRFGIVHGAFGIKPASPDLDTAIHGEAVSFEFIREANPDWLFVVDRDAAIGRGAAASMLDNELVAQTTAWKNDQVVYLDPAKWYLVGGGLTALQSSVDQIAEALSKAD
ncbi:siderophore ABC transporter substrate-binding protein [Consotaella aegiceratis]|uniref:siderophore ABC transporter substrate-binding protein n=1 Tax=Consotaella aegiceratis TaxID=3097961 RepID=UPI002F41E23E